MEGYGDRIVKQGEWRYYNKGIKITSGKFKNSSPLGLWKYKGFKEISWKNYQNNEAKYRIDIPNDWIVNNNYINAVSIVNDTILKKFTTKIDIQIGTIKTSFNEWVDSLKDEMKIDKTVSNVKLKKLNLLDINNSLQIESTRNFNDFGVFEVNQINIEYDNKIYMITIMVKTKSDYSYKIIGEQIMRSFKFVNFENRIDI